MKHVSLQEYSDAGNAVFPAPGSTITTLHSRNEAELIEFMRRASQEQKPVTITAALTGLAGSGVPLESGYRIDISEMTTLEERAGYRKVAPFLLLSEKDFNHGIVAPGISLHALNEVLDQHGLWYPPHPGETRALIGGNVATNASGPRTFAFGSTRAYVESLRVVLPGGDILSLLRGQTHASGRKFELQTESGRKISGSIPDYASPKIKNAAGLFSAPDMDLIDLFIGSEGILGAFSEIGLRFLPRREISAEIFFLPDTNAALNFVDEMRAHKADAKRYEENPSAQNLGILSLEFFDENSLRLAAQSGFHIPKSVPESKKVAVELEWFANDESTRETLAACLKRFGNIGSLAGKDAADFRYSIPRRVAERLKELSIPKMGTDFAVPEKNFRETFRFYEQMENDFGNEFEKDSDVRMAKWGHIGDCHLHCNFLPVNDTELKRAREIYLKLVREAIRLGGTISAEHGVGKKVLADEQGFQRPYLSFMLGEAGLNAIAETKKSFDPHMLLNRGNMIPATMLS